MPPTKATKSEPSADWRRVRVGNYIADDNHIIHDTNGPCFEGVPSDKLITIGPFSTIDEVAAEINDGDQFLEGYSICQECLGE